MARGLSRLGPAAGRSGKKAKGPRRGPKQDAGEPEEIDFDGLYLAARSWDIQPDQAWGLTVREIILEAEMRRPRGADDYAGNLTQGDIDTLEAMLREDG